MGMSNLVPPHLGVFENIVQGEYLDIRESK